MPDYQQELNWAIEAVSQAAVICRHVQSQITPDVLEKKDRSPVTVADFASQAAICRHLLAVAPDDGIVGEEDAGELRKPENAPFLDRIREELARVGIEPTGEELFDWIDRGNAPGGGGRFWTLDPIDGTKGFISKRQYAISLALIVDGQIQVGILGCPNLPVDSSETRGVAGVDQREPPASAPPGGCAPKTPLRPQPPRPTSDSSQEPTGLLEGQPAGILMTAVRGGGAHVIPLDAAAEPKPVAVSRTDDPMQARFCESAESGHSSHSRSEQIAELLGITRPALRLDSQAKYATVARGDADIYFRLPTRKGYVEKIWDHAGGVLVVEEAGGTVSDIDGKPLEFHHGSGLSANRGVLVTNGRLHDRVLKAVAATPSTS